MRVLRSAILPAALLGASLTAFTGAAEAQSSPWRREEGAAVRLISAGRDAEGVYQAGVEITLDPGVKTYWRTPGEAGVPPLLDWSRSANLARAEIGWPAPSTFDDAGSTGFGYLKRVVFPIDVVPQDAEAPLTLDLDLDFALCRDLCVPVRTRLTLRIDPAVSVDPALRRSSEEARRRVPRKVAIGDPGLLRVESVRLDKGAAPPFLDVVLAGPRGAPPELFAEVPAGWPAARPERMDAENGRYRFRVPLRRYAGETGTVILTAASAGQGIELAVDPAELKGE